MAKKNKLKIKYKIKYENWKISCYKLDTIIWKSFKKFSLLYRMNKIHLIKEVRTFKGKILKRWLVKGRRSMGNPGGVRLRLFLKRFIPLFNFRRYNLSLKILKKDNWQSPCRKYWSAIKSITSTFISFHLSRLCMSSRNFLLKRKC